MKTALYIVLIALSLTSTTASAACQIDGTMGLDYVMKAYSDKGFICKVTKSDENDGEKRASEKRVIIESIKDPDLVNKLLNALDNSYRSAYHKKSEYVTCENDQKEISKFLYYTVIGDCHSESFYHLDGVEVVHQHDLDWWGYDDPPVSFLK